VVQTLEFAIEQLCPQQSLSEEQVMIKQQFLSVIHDCETQDLLNIKTINQQLDELYAPSIVSRIKLMTIHQAKGLEFEVVIIPGLGRSPRANQSGIIQLHEFPNQSLLLAPIKSYQDKKSNATYSYLQQMESKQGHFESMRLLYVAMTRAKSNIHLLATLSKSNKASSNTFLKLLEPLLQHQFKNTPTASEDTETITNPPQLERYQTMLNPKRVEGEAYEKVEFNNSLDMGYKSLLGTFTHQCFELGVFEIDQNIINLRLIEMGISTLDLDNASQAILKLLANTKNDVNFNWLFKQRNSTQVEAEFVYKGRSIVIDRLFIEDNVLWIIDFKTAELLSGELIDKYIIRQKSKYTKQLSFYKEVLINNYSGEIKCALYCPSVQKIIEIN
jgi:ATP-dependent exoDNAse (exonuclease V) beta subunit